MLDQAIPESLPLLTEPWCPVEEYETRLAGMQAQIQARGLDALLLLQPESVTWLTGFYTRGYASFQCVLVPPAGAPLTCCRDMEAYYLERTGVFRPHRYWSDGQDPVLVAAEAVRETLGGGDGRLGIEMAAWPLTAARYEALRRALPDLDFEAADDIARLGRRRKSASEIRLMRSAARAAEAGMAAAVASAAAGVSERALAADISAALIQAGSDMPGPGVLSSGERAFHLHGSYIDRTIEPGDIVQFEVLACVRHYHARFMRTIKVGPPSAEERALAERLIAIQDAALAAVGPGVPASVPDAIYRQGVLQAGLAERYTNKTFYGLGLLLPPSGGEGPEADASADWSFEPGMTFHSYVLARNFGFSETILVTETGMERLTGFPRELLVAGGTGAAAQGTTR